MLRAEEGLMFHGQRSRAEQVDHHRRRFLGAAAMAIASASFKGIASAKIRSQLSAFDGATVWLNSEPLKSTGLHGKVVLVDFWTYSCINWRRQLPYVRAWAEKYKSQGLVVIGVHSPEFSFEKNVDNVRWATKDMRVDYPVVIDNDHAIWRAFNNEYWPALYFADAKGRIRHSIFGEGQYEQSEARIQRLLSEAGVDGIRNDLISVAGRGAEAAADWKSLYSGENYLGYERTANFSSSGGAKPYNKHEYSVPKKLALNSWALSGVWTIGSESVAPNQANGRIVYRFHARDLHLVMGPARSNLPVPFRVSIDGQAPQNAHGVDVDELGNGTVKESRMYQLIRQPSPVLDREFQIQFLDSGVDAFSFTFG